MHLSHVIPMIQGRLADPNGVMPWAESNQGLLSLIALLVALAIAVYEVKRAARSETRNERAYCDWAIKCAEHSMKMSEDASHTILTDDRSIYATPLVQWRFQNGSAIALLEEVMPDKPKNPEITFQVNRLLRIMNLEVAGLDGSQEALDGLRSHFSHTQICRDHIERIKPKSDRERFAALVARSVGFARGLYPVLRYWRPFRETSSYIAQWGQPFDLTQRPY